MTRNQTTLSLAFFLAALLACQQVFAGPPSGWPRSYDRSEFGSRGSSDVNAGQILGSVLENIVKPAIESSRSSNQGDSYRSYRPRTIEYTPPRPTYVPRPTPAPTPPPTPKNVAPKKNRAPVVKTKTRNNLVFDSSQFLTLTSMEIEQAQDKLKEQQEERLDEIESLLEDELPPEDGELITMLENEGISDPQDQLAIIEAVRNGDSGKAQILIRGAGGSAAAAKKLGQQTELQSDLDGLRELNHDGQLNQRDIAKFEDSVRDVVSNGGSRDKILDQLADLSDFSIVQGLLEKATPNAGMGNFGNSNVTVIYNPNLPEGKLVNLGNGMIMVGIRGDQLSVGETSLAEAVGMPIAATSPVPESDAKIPTDGVVLRNDKDSQSAISYVINDRHDYTMNPGHVQTLGTGTWVIRFDRGGSFGEGKYSLTKGTYEFMPSDQGWTLYSKKFEIMIDNTQNPNDFHYVVDNVAKTIPARSTQAHSSAYPIEVRFDRGNGLDEQRKVLSEGSFQIAVNPTDNLWELYTNEMTAESNSSAGLGITLFGN